MGGAYPGGQEFNFDCGEVAIPFHFNQNSLLLDFTLSQTLKADIVIMLLKNLDLKTRK